ncbi:hypothetical protein B0T16DRAFT_419616 [Cercophora newfieldiana]|uniref:Fumarylacetoacetase n=1 Tax=Cercophora newfieldiana TaxID=92897 RepID=A0AA39XW05_9PEZI|nr:hypothetical protein B0T16DRAFT_419616 [Cercophora newfieldiana]
MAATWVPDVDPDSDFSLENLPFGILGSTADPKPHAAVAIGTYILDLKALLADPGVKARLRELFPRLVGHENVFAQPSLNAFAEMGRAVHRQVRATLRDLLRADTPYPEVLRDNEALRKKVIVPQRRTRNEVPMKIGDYTDFYAGYHHAVAVGTMFRGADNALQPNYTHLPVGYHGRASSIFSTNMPIRRPFGQFLPDPAANPKQPITGLSRKLDFELELGCFISMPPIGHGTAVAVNDADEYIFGYVLLNDWSARDIQGWEYVPLGPFMSKNFATTISPWVVLADALEPFRTEAIPNPTVLQDYLKQWKRRKVFDIRLEVDLTTQDGNTTTITKTNAKNLMWSFPQMIAHHTLGGCPIRSGDLLGSGTISGPGGGSECGSLLEMSQNGKTDVVIYGDEKRTFIEDGDTITLRGWCGEDGARVGFGPCKGRVWSPAPEYGPVAYPDDFIRDMELLDE